MTSLQAKVDAVKIAVASTSICSSTTVTTLNNILLSGKVTKNVENSSGSRLKVKRRGDIQSIPEKSVRGTSNRSRKISPGDGGNEDSLSLREKESLATEVINSTLKVLSEHAKSRNLIQPTHPKEAKKTPRPALHKTASSPQSPLVPRSLNRVSSSPSIITREKSTSSLPASQTCPPGCRAVAECALAAFECLRNLQMSNSSSTHLKSLQLEIGMSALIGRLINLGLDDIALKELRMLKQRLESSFHASGTTFEDGNSAPRRVKGEHGVTLARLVDIFEFKSLPHDVDGLCLATAVQLHGLKILTTVKNQDIIQAVIPSLQSKQFGSPVRLLVRLATDTTQVMKATKQMEILSQLLLSLSPNVSSSADDIATSSKCSVRPEAAFQLQSLAFQVRQLWWKFGDQAGDLEQDILSPFSKCVAAFSRRSQCGASLTYDIARRCFESLEIPSSHTKSIEDPKSSIFRIYKLLGSMAQEAGDVNAANLWLGNLYSHLKNAKAVDAQRYAVAARITSIKLKDSKHHDEAETFLISVLEGLEQPLKGEIIDLNDLLMEVSNLRRIIISILSRKRDDAKDSQCDGLDKGIRQMCESFIFICPRFAMRYLGKHPDKSASTKDVLRFEQRRQILLKSAFHTVDSVLYLVKIIQAEKRLTWELLDSALQDCLALLASVQEDLMESNAKSQTPNASYFVKISHLYYSQHLNMLRDSQDPKDTKHLRALRRSIDCIRLRPANEKQAVLLTSKLERMAEILKGMGRYEEAKEAVCLLRDELSQSGVMDVIAAAAGTVPVRAVLDQNEDTAKVARVVSLSLKLEVKKASIGSQVLTFVDLSWPAPGRGILLEYAVEIASLQKGDTQSTLNLLFRELFKIYDSKTYPIRRLRAISSMLRLLPDHRHELVVDLKTTIAFAGLENVLKESQDSALSSYLPYFQSSASSLLELLEDYPRIDLIIPHLTTINTIMESCGKDKSMINSKIDDVSVFLKHLGSIADYLDMKGSGKTRAAVLKIITGVYEISPRDVSPDGLILAYAALAMQYLDLGYSGKAGLALNKAQVCVASNGVTSMAQLRLQISYAEYHLRIGNSVRSEEILSHARTLVAERDFNSLMNDQAISFILDKNQGICLWTDSFLVHSHLALDRGTLQAALTYAKQSLRLISGAWMNLERKHKGPVASCQEEQLDNLTSDVANLGVSISMQPLVTLVREKIVGPSAWALAKPMFRALLHLSNIYSMFGMFQETLYYAEQAQKIAETIGSPYRLAEALTNLGNIWLHAGSLDKASGHFNHAAECSSLSKDSRISVALKCRMGLLYGRQGNQVMQMEAYEDARLILETLMDPKYISAVDCVADPLAALEKEMSHLELSSRPGPSSRRVATSKRSVSKRTTTKKNDVRQRAVPAMKSSVSDECIEITSQKGILLRQKALALMIGKKSDEATAILAGAADLVSTQMDIIDHKLAVAQELFLRGIEQMVEDPVYSVLQDSTISFPATIACNKATGSTIEKTRPSPKRMQSNSLRTTGRPKSPSLGIFDRLKQAYEYLTDAQTLAMQISPTHVIYHISSLLHATSILLSLASPTKGQGVVQTGVATSSLEMARNLAIRREHNAVHDYNGLSSRRDDCAWPGLLPVDSKGLSDGTTVDLARFQKEYVDIIPPTWTVMSIALSDDRHDLCITKLQAGSSPFVLRLPLGRNNSRDADEQIFDFEQGRKELLDIIDLANFSAHGARNITGKGAKTAWWAERDALNARLKDLLENIEKVWLGGFRGIFSQFSRQPELLARFQKSFQNILDKHLPSRQKSGTKAKGPRINLDIRILELFIGLGEGCLEDSDLDEPLTDLLYFVVDILQFHGERNAYDEIDFDSIVVETQDALRCYHEALRTSSPSMEHRHTILILDKALHSFPWESLPCVQGLAVSRLPSLECLRDRLYEQKKNAQIDPVYGHYIDRENGSYILNPGGDLKATQSTFQPDLRTMTSWVGRVQQEPSEADMKEYLESRDLLLYFGHGSGAQYIRAKTIKKLEKCAVTVLMGCSSGALTDAGDFEPYGPPINYMLAGSAAVVATLWDVTDKDIDRFAKSMFENWGLFNTSTARSGKGVERWDVQSPGGYGNRVSLVEAVARGRTACNFQYLTAAAVCVYGIPVYFR